MSKKHKNRKKYMGSSIDDFLKEEGIFEESQVQAIKEVVAWQLDEAMRKQKTSKNKMATLLKTSRTQVDRLLNPKNDITLSSLQRAAAMVGRRVMIELVWLDFFVLALCLARIHRDGPGVRFGDVDALSGVFQSQVAFIVEGARVLLFEKESMSKDNTTVEGQARLGTVPTDEFVDGTRVRFLGTWYRLPSRHWDARRAARDRRRGWPTNMVCGQMSGRRFSG